MVVAILRQHHGRSAVKNKASISSGTLNDEESAPWRNMQETRKEAGAELHEAANAPSPSLLSISRRLSSRAADGIRTKGT